MKKLIDFLKFTAGVLAAANAMAPVPVIIGGNIVAEHSEPYILSLQRSGSHFCGGSLGTFVSKGVTAAHCYYSSGVTAVAGAHNIKQSESTTQKIQVDTFRRHPNYNSRTLINDIAVLLLRSSFVIDDYVVPISLPAHQNNEWMPNGADVRVCGWGNTSSSSSNYPSELHCVNVDIVSNSICNDRSHYNGEILKGMFCAGILDVGGKDACQGDSGGPVTYNGQLVGATSWGYGCAQAKYPGVYTDVAMFKNWIDSQ